MTTENWISISGTIVAAATTVVCTWWGHWLKIRAEQPPLVNQDKAEAKPIRRRTFATWVSWGLNSLAISTLLYSLVSELLKTGPVSRTGVFVISFTVGVLLFLLISAALQALLRLINGVVELQATNAENVGEMLQNVLKMAEGLGTTASAVRQLQQIVEPKAKPLPRKKAVTEDDIR